MLTLQKAHQMDPKDASTIVKMCALLVAECEKVGSEEADALMGDVSIISPRMRALREATRTRFEQAIRLNGSDITTMHNYAKFAASILRDTRLASDLWKRIEELKRETSK
ncbi:hypothetical protein STCU_11689 [Strigomonas culicis]|uniref:Uncharacterized protein n=1 Tax=Strigomonas culicis TaxID=28005 RepID=S9TCZ5_9TRYP|nr:hypothetical protein STCU_11689 [Strigomonas culicis]|eukprot:EPY15897.1 hypothetical protein STCU_11689 [Strigomonas culicis]